jgi:Flp pilus assembly protein TadG
MLAILKTKLIALVRDTRANIAMTFSLCFGVLATAAGGGLDYSRAVGIGNELQSALDSGVLAAASLTQARDPEAVVRAYVEAALSDHPSLINSLNVSVTRELALNSREVGATATVRVPTTLLGIAGIEHITVMRETRAEERMRNIEISLVLDISSSMRGNRIYNLREAAIDFVDTMLGADAAGMTSISIIPYGGTVKLDDSFFRYVTNGETYSPPGFNWQLDVPDSVDDWNGCLELNRQQVDRIELTPGGHGIVPNFTVWNRNNPWCPDEEGTEAVFLSNDRSRLVGLLSNFDNPILSDGTGTDIGMGWGVRALDPSWQGGLNGDAGFSNRPAAYGDGETLKVLVVMTDGGITQQRRPERGWTPVLDLVHMGSRGTDDLYSTNQARSNFANLCRYARDNDVVVYSIAFQVGGGRNRRDMEDCATSPAQFYNVEDLNIAEAFSAIAADLTQLRLSR